LGCGWAQKGGGRTGKGGRQGEDRVYVALGAEALKKRSGRCEMKDHCREPGVGGGLQVEREKKRKQGIIKPAEMWIVKKGVK